MLSLQKEVERIIKHTGDYNRFTTDEQFSKTYRLTDDILVLKKIKDITVIFSDYSFVFRCFSHSLEWYPIQVLKGSELISIVINYENGRAYSARNWYRFLDLAEEMARMLTGMEPEVWNPDQKQISEEIVFKQMNLW